MKQNKFNNNNCVIISKKQKIQCFYQLLLILQQVKGFKKYLIFKYLLVKDFNY